MWVVEVMGAQGHSEYWMGVQGQRGRKRFFCGEMPD